MKQHRIEYRMSGVCLGTPHSAFPFEYDEHEDEYCNDDIRGISKVIQYKIFVY